VYKHGFGVALYPPPKVGGFTATDDKDKAGGLAVDYLGIAADLKEALSFYSEAGGRGEPALVQDEAIALMQEKIQVLDGIMHGYDYHRYRPKTQNYPRI